MFTFGLVDDAPPFDPLLLLVLALVIEALIGGFLARLDVVPHPVALIGRLVGVLDRKLNREHRPEIDRAVRGLLVVVFVVALAGAVGWVAARIGRTPPFGWCVELALLVTLLSARELFDRVRAVARALERHGLADARRAVSHIVGRDPQRLDAHGVARGAIESAAENFSDGVVAPAFWYVLFGFPGLLVYKAVNTMDSMIGYTSARYRAFGLTAARLDDALNLIPARLSGVFLVLGAIFVPTARPFAAVKVMLRDAGKHRSLNAGWPEGAMAGALGLALAGPRSYADGDVHDPWVGDGSSRATGRDIRRALYLYCVAWLINLMWVTSIAIIRLGLST